VVTECGRQPWLVHDILRTADASSPVPGGSVLVTLVLFVLAYGVVFSFGIYYINRLIAKGLPSPVAKEAGKFSQNPISAAHDG
jgi:Cytochrome bd-type quinol oxidase, subunit 1